jgi:RNA polymerase sigma-70 factor (ECF subfamily)
MRYKQDVFSYLLSITHNKTLAEDLLQETFLKAIFSAPKFRGDSSIKTWLFGIARNTWLQNLRKEKASIEYSDFLQLYVTESIESSLISKETVNMVNELLESKDERTREIIHMRTEGYSYFEISEKMGICESSARVIDFRIKKWLKDILQKEGLL